MDDFFAPQDDLRLEIAMAAARLIAEDGYDYPSARNKAIKELVGNTRLPRDRIPLDAEIEQEVRNYQSLYLSDTQPQELLRLRQTALSLMLALQEFEPIIYGASVNGTGSHHSDLHVLAFSDNPKEIDFWLLNRDIAFEACEDALLAGRAFPAVSFQWKDRWVQLGCSDPRDRRGLLKRNESLFQTDAAGLQRLLEDPAQ
jgi:hypothetical protein